MISVGPPELRGFAGVPCVVTGGLGFIGSNLVHALLAAGARVRVIDALVPEHGGDLRNLEGISGAEILIGDLAAPKVDEFIADSAVIFNVAGQVSHHASMVDPLRDLDLNVRSHVAFLETVRRVVPKARIVLTSTRQVYGRPERIPVDELHPTRPVDVNGVDKLACEQFHLLYGVVHGLRPTVLRLTNVYGPRQNLVKDDLGAIPVFIRRALLGDDIRLFGTGMQRRDCLHVDDIVRAMTAATDDRSVGEIINLGHEHSWTLKEIVETIVRCARSSSRVEYVEWPEELARIDIGDFHGDWTKAGELLGWKPSIELAEGIEETLRFYERNPWYLSSI